MKNRRFGKRLRSLGGAEETEDCHLLVREKNDFLRAGHAQYRVAEPLITFYEAVMRPSWGRLEAGQGEVVWRESTARFASQVAGPHFEALCRDFQVGVGVVTDPGEREQIQVDVVVLAPGTGTRRRRIIALGEAKWGR